MVGYMNLEEQVDREFRFACRKALLGRIAARLRRDVASTRLPRFDEVRRISGALEGIQRGMWTVPVKRVLGSVGRHSEIDRGFMPARASVEERWKRIDQAFHRGEVLPPVRLYKLGHSYYVLDCHNRVSVARFPRRRVDRRPRHGVPRESAGGAKGRHDEQQNNRIGGER